MQRLFLSDSCATALFVTIALLLSINPTAQADVFETDSCSGNDMTWDEARSHFTPGSSSTSLGTYSIHGRQRPCNTVTGCGSWGALAYSGLPLGGSFPLGLGISRDNIYLTLRLPDNRMAWCSRAASAPVTCTLSYGYWTGYFSGKLTNRCAHLVFDERTTAGIHGDYVHRQYVLFSRF